MKLTVIPVDGAVYKDGFSYSNLNLTGIPNNVHALQWDNGAGWIEFKNENEFRKPANQSITALPDWANAALTKWNEAKAAEEAAMQAASQTQPSVDGAETL